MDILPIETPRLLLRQFAVEDAEDVAGVIHNANRDLFGTAPEKSQDFLSDNLFEVDENDDLHMIVA